jgi:hypothetical protein
MIFDFSCLDLSPFLESSTITQLLASLDRSPVVVMDAAFRVFPHGIKSHQFNKPRATK